MCGITGGVGRLSEDILSNMVNKIHHRGPDNQSWEIDGEVYLGHTRLSIIDLSPESNQPLWDSTGRGCIVFNGEIYNYKTIREELVEQGVVFKSHGDAEVLLNLYLKHGEKALNQLEGIFSFCIWDKQENALFIARDHFGVKPLYYAQNDQGFYFSSEIKSLLCVPSISRELHPDALFRSLVFLYSPGEDTLFKSIKKVRPGHFMQIKQHKVVRYEQYWRWPEYQPGSLDADSQANMVLDSVGQAVDQQLVADVPVGAFLSGGLDSSLLVALASKKQNIRCFTIDSTQGSDANDGFEDDLPYAKKVAEHLGVELDILKATPDIVQQLPEMIYYLDELQADPAPLNVLMICEQAQKQGMKVLLSGAGGDDVYSGYRRHVAIQLEKYWDWLPSPVRTLLKQTTSLLPKSNPTARRIAKAFSYANLDDNQRLLSYFYWIDPDTVRGLFKPEIQSQLSQNPMSPILQGLEQLDCDDPLEKMLYLERNYFLVDHNFNYTDKMSMARGVEVRVPFLDKNIADKARHIPSSLKQKGKVGKWILKKAAEKCLPHHIIYRPKSGFGAPLRKWLKTDLLPLVDDLLSAEKINARGIFDPTKVATLIHDDRSGKEDYSYPIFALLCFEIWCQKFVDNND